VLALVQRRGREIGGEAAELGRLAGEQEVALRALVGSSADGSVGGRDPDLRALLTVHSAAGVTISAPASPVLLPAEPARELAAAVAAALDNVRRHAGAKAHTWVLIEDDADAVTVTIRDDGAGMSPQRLAEAAADGRLGASQSIRGRLRDLGGDATWTSAPGEGTEVELRLPRVSDRTRR
jgi:signal transduction histidine kinase